MKNVVPYEYEAFFHIQGKITALPDIPQISALRLKGLHEALNL
jgi:hypothetical protein